MYLLVESIRVEYGKLLNISFHNERIVRSLHDLFGSGRFPGLETLISVPEFAAKGIFKCRFLYDDKNSSVEFLPYIVKPVRSLKLLTDNDIEYSYKFSRRENILKLTEKRGECDDIIIIKEGMVTDTSFANVVLKDEEGKWVTPSTYLLPGTRRARLLRQGIIKENKISSGDIGKYSEIRLINAMIGLDDSEGIPVSMIF